MKDQRRRTTTEAAHNKEGRFSWEEDEETYLRKIVDFDILASVGG